MVVRLPVLVKAVPIPQPPSARAVPKRVTAGRAASGEDSRLGAVSSAPSPFSRFRAAGRMQQKHLSKQMPEATAPTRGWSGCTVFAHCWPPARPTNRHSVAAAGRGAVRLPGARSPRGAGAPGRATDRDCGGVCLDDTLPAPVLSGSGSTGLRTVGSHLSRKLPAPRVTVRGNYSTIGEGPQGRVGPRPSLRV